MGEPTSQQLDQMRTVAAFRAMFAAAVASRNAGGDYMDAVSAGMNANLKAWNDSAGTRFWIIEDFEQFEGELYGNGECPQICQVHGGIGHSSTWIQGPAVRGNPAIPRGTAIATFIGGRYPSKAHGNHVAIYIEQDPAKGVRVFDQWRGKSGGAGYRWLPWKDGVTDRSNDGSAMSVILTRVARPAPKKAAKKKN